ncbi:hypothetical protein [Aliidiomarina maris]|uniref:Uncharacterized protein n=1 Tax=Aliidiomarina maris TaxID=531312 RepID=A0A327X4R9_9GAMM|nr:hypothetical protein [Aliidiomarina maris]RAK01639.1 hypothetical protein B0I24_101262 [Aliidiomarina maris]RUO28463.1 hypothetical protein CWE07_01250 [Aliidiomarina maris]
MNLLKPTSSRSRAELKLLFRLRFACLLSKYENVMQDTKVINRSLDLVNQLERQGVSREFKEKFIRDEAKGKFIGANLGEQFFLTVAADRREVTITRQQPMKGQPAVEVRYA